jgi:hypothetical protein
VLLTIAKKKPSRKREPSQFAKNPLPLHCTHTRHTKQQAKSDADAGGSDDPGGEARRRKARAGFSGGPGNGGGGGNGAMAAVAAAAANGGGLQHHALLHKPYAFLKP